MDGFHQRFKAYEIEVNTGVGRAVRDLGIFSTDSIPSAEDTFVMSGQNGFYRVVGDARGEMGRRITRGIVDSITAQKDSGKEPIVFVKCFPIGDDGLDGSGFECLRKTYSGEISFQDFPDREY